MGLFWQKCVLFLIFGILGTYSDGDPFPKQPRLLVKNGHLTITGGLNRNVTIAANGNGNVLISNVSMKGLASSRNIESASMSTLNRRMGEILTQWQSVSDLANQVNQLEDNVTDIAQRMNTFVGTDQNRITNRGMRRYFAKIKMLEDKVNHLTELLSTNECSSNPCRNGGTCVDSYNGYVCNCPPTWEGPTCENDVNECALYAGTAFGCQHGATCTNQLGSYRCECPPNWYGIHCTEQLDDCNAASHQELCGHGTCVNENRVQPGQPKYRCICDPGWTKASDSPACTQDVDECQGAQQKCSVNPRVLCINLPGSFFCGPCPAGYTGNGLYCEDINECENQNGGCSMNPFVECYNIPGSRRCGPCPAGYFGNGEQCMFQSVCSNDRGGCHPLATCIDNPAITATYRECRCPPGYVGSGEGLTGCVQTQGITCANNPCQHGTCQTVGNSYHCVCEAGYYGTNCENAQDVCSRNPCQNGGTCVSGAGTFTCICPNRYSGPTCAQQQRVCGGYLTGDNGTLHYPEYSIHYDHEESCAWVITVDEGKVVNVTFDHFHLEGGYNCEFDFLQLNDGPNAGSRVIGRFCSDQLHGDTFTSTHNQVYLWFKSDRTISATGFTITWKAVDPICGGVFNVSEYGSVRSPGYPGLYPVNRTCSWLVQVPFGKRIQFSFATLMLEHHDNCSYDYLKVIDGASDQDPVIGTYCTTNTPPPLITSGHAATLLFHSDHSVQDSGFNIAYSAVPGIHGCGGTLTAPKGSVTSPNFPDVTENNLVCEWLIRIHPDNRIKVSFTDFSLETHLKCAFDSVEIFDGPSDEFPLLGRFCGDSLPLDIISNSHQLYVRFKSDMSVPSTGFKLRYRTICGGVYSELAGTLTSPYYPDPYPAEATCLYEVRLPQGYIVNLTIDSVDIESHPSCRYDYLEIRDGDSENSALLSTVCGTTSPMNFVSTFNKLWMKFATDASVNNRGFSAEYHAIEIGCGGIQTENNGQISSPRHPYSYPHSVTCTWLIRAPAGFIIRLSFSAFLLESSSNCDYDYVLVEDVDGNQIGKFCGQSIPPVLTSLDDTLLVKFVTDASISRDGFVASYEFLDASQACGGEFFQTSGVLSSPGYPLHYPHLADCVWVLHAQNGHQITLNVTDFNLETHDSCKYDYLEISPEYPLHYPHLADCVWVLHAQNGHQITLNVTDFNLETHDSCKYDYLEIRNGGYQTSPLIGKYCGTEIMRTITSHSTLMRLAFKSDGSMSAPGFQIAFDSTVMGCGGILTAASGSIISPNYPQAYPLNADCQWLIKVSAGSSILLSIVEIDIEQHDTCQYDYLQVFDGDSENSKSLVRVCNNQQHPGTIVSSGNTMLIRFRSDSSEEAGGFHLVYHTQCNNVLTKRRGAIESPNFPNSYPHNHNCTWTIQAPPGSNISISFSHIFMEGDGLCRYDYVEVMERQRVEGPVSLGKFCGEMTRPPSTITTTTNTAIVTLITDRSVSREGFRLEYSFVGCGGDIMNKPYGWITSPNYPNAYPVSTLCYWHIWYPPGNSVEFTIEEINIESSTPCYYDFLKVYGGADESGPVLLDTCESSSSAQTITSHGNEIYVHFQSDVSITNQGFKAKFRKLPSGCGGRFTASAATIASPNFPDAYSTTDECEWLIEVNSVNRVELHFVQFEMPDAANCSRGYVAIYDGNNSSAPLLLKHCGAKPELPINATGNQMLVMLVPDGINVAKGFQALYKTSCGRRLLADNGGEITSLNYPNMPSYETNCSWILYASEIGEKVSLTITHINLMDTENCTSSAIYVQDGDMEDSPVIGQYCGHRLPPTIISRGSILHVRLEHAGIFRATYGLLSQHCGGAFTSAAGSFSSPGYPTNYDMEMECVWTIEASAGSLVHVTFQSFHLENSDYCNSDYVEIHENDPSGRLIGKYCGDSIPSNVTAAHKLWIKFRSDDIGTAAGFMAHYEIQHSITITGTSGDIASPGYPHKYQHDSDFEWTVIVPTHMFVSAYFSEMGIAAVGGEYNCASYVKIIDGFDEEAPVLGLFCGFDIPEPLISTSNVITIKYHSEEYLPGVFYLHWAAVNESGARTPEGISCLEEHIINATEVATIQSPNFPQNYPDDYNCTYIIRTVPTHHVDLVFESFQMEGYPPACAFDKVESFYPPNPSVDQWVLNSTLCGDMNNLQLSSPNNVMKLEMSTDRWINQGGFKAVAKSECGGQLFGNGGVLRSSSIYPNIVNISRYETFVCEWVITVKERRTIQLTFEKFNIVSDPVCSYNYILIRNGGFSTSPILGTGRYCGSTIPILPESSSNQVYVQVSYKPSVGSSPLFDLRYALKTMGCGGHLYLDADSPSTEITSPNYPSPPTHDAECEWIIVSPSGTRMRVDFESSFQMNLDCYGGEEVEYLEIHDGGTENAEVLKRYCGHDEPSSVMSTGNALYMKFVTGVDDRGSGFKANVVMAHCGGTISSTHALISSPNFPQDYPPATECEWFLKMRYGYHIILTITEFETPTSSNCSLTDYLEIRSIDREGELLGTYCGNPSTLPIVIDVPGPSAYMKFKSNPSVTAKGFSVQMAANYDDGCGATLEGSSGVITSPRYPNALTVPKECFWRIYVPAGRKIKVTFNEINLPYDENLGTCASFVAIFNVTHRMQSRRDDYKYRYCGTTLPDEIDSASSGLYIVFNTHGLSAGQGFSLSYSSEEESDCGGALTPPSGSLVSPNLTVQADTFVECLWKMNLEENQTMSVKFDFLDLPGSVANFCRPSVFYAFTTGWFIGGFCGNITNGFLITLPYPSVTFKFLTSLERPVGGFRAFYNISNCGGILDGSNTEITSPGYPNGYPPGIDCEWQLVVPYGEVIQLTVQDLRLETDCTKDYLMFRNGRQVTSPTSRKFCGTSNVAPITSTGGTLSVIFHSDNFGSAPGFRLSTSEVQRGCGGFVHAPSGNLSSPNYPSRYTDNVECVWTIEYLPGSLVKIDFIGRFDIEMDATCSKDYLRIDEMGADGRWVTGEQKCGSTPPPSYRSKSNKVRLMFHSNERISGDGFNLTYRSECGGNFTDSRGDIISPNYPNMYTDRLNCSYVIGKSGDYISLTFDDLFSVEGHENCMFDYIEIYQIDEEESHKQGRYCGDITPAPRTLVGPVTIKFVTDYVYTAHGFKLHYEILNCGASFNSPSGVISTPNATGEYINNMDCTWHINGVADQVIQIRFLHFDLEDSYGCWRDFLEIFDGNSTSSPQIGRFCGKGVNAVKSTGSDMTLRFRTNYMVTSKGFAAYYFRTYGEARGCGGNLNSTSGEIRSPDINSDGSYDPNLDCAWMILANEPDQAVKLEFQTFDLQPARNGSCETDFLEIRDYSSDGTVLGRYCGNRKPDMIMTTAPRVLVHFHTDGSGSGSGFRLSYTVTPSPCGPSTLLTGPEPKVLTSPGHPNAYPTGIRCKWTISRNFSSALFSGSQVDISVTSLDIPCGGDYLEIRRTRMTTTFNARNSYQMQSDDDSVRTCGTAPPKIFHIRNSAEITFNSDPVANGGHGFSLTYKDASCNSMFTEDNGIIPSSYYPMRINAVTFCLINITVSEGKTVSLYFKQFDIMYSSNCEQGYMKIYDGNSTSSPMVATYCGESIPNPVFSTGQSLTLDIKLPSRLGLYFMTYTSTDKGRGCGGRLDGVEGSFTSPLYPAAYDRDGECLWYITVPGYHTVKLQFTSFALNSTAGCDMNYMEIYEGSIDDISKRVARYCGSDVPGDHELRSNQAVVKLVTDSTNKQPGFYANFEMSSFVPENLPVGVAQIFS